MSKKLEDKEFQEIQELRKNVTEIASILGDLNYQKMSLDIMIEEQRAKIVEIKRREVELFDNIRKVYGNVSLNLETGEIN